ncbi:DUF4185 domain-containing protein [Marmoricola sp. URHB0036]|uniref:DUF4185 domain-containing protein n=1 Tax=Marmoricola sp. URHB0036 TaxID=1298863 RepID=UPI00041FFE52|nr:DUF4185 domain-containing protein [Marmoricola sp. URHB0036]
MSRRTSRTTWAVLGPILLAQVGLLAWHHTRVTAEPHRVPVAVEGPAAVSQSIAHRLNALPGEPLDAVVVAEGDDPRAGVRNGGVVAALAVDPSTPGNVLYVSSVNDPKMTSLAKTMATRVGTPLGRTFVTRVVPPTERDGPARSTVAVVSGCWVAGGFLLAVLWLVVRWRRGTTTAPAVRAHLVLVAACSGVSLVVAVALAAGGSWWAWWALGFACTYAAAVSTVALDVLFGPVGVALASTLFLFLAGPLMSGRDPHLLPGFWWRVAPWTLQGATREIAGTIAWFGSAVPLRSMLVLGGVIVVSLAALVASAQLRRPVDPHRRIEAVPWRLRVVALVLPLAVTVVAATLLAPTGARVVSARPVPGASTTQCVATPKISTLAELNQFAGNVRGEPAFQGADVGADVLLQDGRRLWVFGDTLRAADFSGQRFVRNSMLVLGGGCAATVLPADRGAIIPDRGDGIGYWPMSIARVQRSDYDLVGVATQRVKSTGTPDGSFAFESLGSSVAVFIVQKGGTPQLLAQQDLGPDDKNPAHPQWGAAAAAQGDWVYLYGTARPDEKGVFGFSLQVARTRIENILTPSTWGYWDGRKWQASPSKAKELIAADQGVSQTLSVFPRDGRWYAVSKRDEFLGTDLVVWSAPAPTGPFDDGTVVGHLPSDLKTGELRYMPLAHPDLLADPGSVLVSYSRNNTDLQKVEDDPFLYRPQFVRVALPR